MRAAVALVLALAVAGCATADAVQMMAVPHEARTLDGRSPPSLAVFDLAALIADRQRGALNGSARDEINRALARLIGQGREGRTVAWVDPEGLNDGVVRLSRLGALVGDGRTCALVQHENRLDRAFVRGSIRLCRRGDGNWQLDDVVWRRSGGDLAGMWNGRHTA